MFIFQCIHAFNFFISLLQIAPKYKQASRTQKTQTEVWV